MLHLAQILLFAIFSRYDTSLTRFGDQCIVVRRDFYEYIGGFPEWELFEDVYFLNKARKHTRIRSIESTVRTSSRRFQKNGTLKQLFWNFWLMIQYYCGKPPDKLAEMYRRRL